MIGSPNPAYLVYDGDNSDNGAPPRPGGSATVERVPLERLARRRNRRGHRLRRPLGLRAVHRGGHPAGGLFTGAEEVKTPEEAALGRPGRLAVRPVLPPGLRPLDNIDRTALDRNVDAFAGTIGRFALSTDGVHGVGTPSSVVDTGHPPMVVAPEQQEGRPVRAGHLQPGEWLPPPRPASTTAATLATARPAAHFAGRAAVDGERVRRGAQQVGSGDPHRTPRRRRGVVG